MRTKIQKSGEYLTIQIPPEIATETQLDSNSIVDISIHNKQLIIKPLDSHQLSLEELLGGINSENIHKEIDFGKPVGNEIW